jgi:hypothetical protein
MTQALSVFQFEGSVVRWPRADNEEYERKPQQRWSHDGQREEDCSREIGTPQI